MNIKKRLLQKQLPASLNIQRAQTQINVNKTVLLNLVNRLSTDIPKKVLDVPCGDMEFLSYLATLYPGSKLHGADIALKKPSNDVRFVQMDLTADFKELTEDNFDLVTSISGVMMFGNTLSFVKNCVSKLKTGGTFILTNDNPATIIDRLSYLFLARYRIFGPVYEDTETLTQIVPIQELCRLMRIHGIEIESIEYTSAYTKDWIFMPVAILIYPIQWFYLKRLKTTLPASLKKMMYPFGHLFCKHYIITGYKI